MKMTKVKLGDILEAKRGTSLSGEYYDTKGKYIRLTLGNFNYPGGGFKENNIKKDIYFTGPIKKEFILHKGDIITPLTEQVAGLLGETARIPESDKFIQSADVALLIPNEKYLDKDYMYYLISSSGIKKQLSAAAQQTKIRHTSPDKIKLCETWIPPLEFQKKAAGLLKAIDDMIANNMAIILETTSIAKTLYDYWFMQFDFPDENGQPYKSSGGKMVWNDTLKRDIPLNWNVINVGDIVVNHDSKRIPLKNAEREKMIGNIPYYGATGIMGYVNRAIFDGDFILLAEDGSVMTDDGKPILQRISGKTWVNNHAHVLEPSNGYHCRLLMQILAQIPVVKIKTGSIQAKITQDNLNKFQVVDMPDSIKQKANEIFDVIDEMLLHLEQEIEELSSLGDFLLPLLMSGQVTFKETEA